MTQTVIPQTDADLFGAEIVKDPWPALHGLRALAPVVYSTVHDFYLLSRYDDVRAAAREWQSFTSKHGVALTEQFNQQIAGSVLATDPPEHDALREVLADKLAPRGLSHIREQVAETARQLVDPLVARGAFDGVVDVARVFPITVVADLVGLPLDGREKMHPGADATFAGFGPFGDYVAEHLPQLRAYHEWMLTMADRAKLTPGGWGEAIMDAVDDGRLTQLGAIRTVSAYLTAGMDTTVNAVGALMRLFADQPEIWAAVREDPSLAPRVVEEILRLESPVVGFFRVTTRDVDIDSYTIPEGAKVLLHFAAANRDPAKYADPDAFQIDRNPLDHLAFGHGTHTCAGQGLARMELVVLLEVMAERIESVELAGAAVRGRNPVVRGYDSVPLIVKARSGR